MQAKSVRTPSRILTLPPEALPARLSLNPELRMDHGRAKAFGPGSEFLLPTRAALSRDAAWVSNARLDSLSKKQRRRFPTVAGFELDLTNIGAGL